MDGVTLGTGGHRGHGGQGAAGAGQQGGALHLHPVKPKFKPPVTKRLKLNCDILLSNCAFDSNTLSYSEEEFAKRVVGRCTLHRSSRC